MSRESDHIFYHDELLGTVQDHWSDEDLLSQPALFFLKDVCAKLEIKALTVSTHAKALAEQGQDTYAVMGVRKIWNHWYVRMLVFAPYYRAQLEPNINRVQSGWDANLLLAQKGVFMLSQVCKRIPFTSGQLRHQARKCGVDQCGIFKREDGLYLVDMEVFAPWLIRLWQEGFDHSAPVAAKSRQAFRGKRPPKEKTRRKRTKSTK